MKSISSLVKKWDNDNSIIGMHNNMIKLVDFLQETNYGVKETQETYLKMSKLEEQIKYLTDKIHRTDNIINNFIKIKKDKLSTITALGTPSIIGVTSVIYLDFPLNLIIVAACTCSIIGHIKKIKSNG